MHYRGYEYTPSEFERWGNTLKEIYNEALVAIEEVEEKVAAKPIVTIQDRQRVKVLDTIMEDWDG